MFNFSDYLEDSKSFDPAKKNVIGKMKDEVKGKIISEFVGLKTKMCFLGVESSEEIKKGKDVNKDVVKNIRHEEYVEILFNKNMIRHKMKSVESKLHKIGTHNVCKISLSCFNDKRYILNDDINSLGYFHKDVRSQ